MTSLVLLPSSEQTKITLMSRSAAFRKKTSSGDFFKEAQLQLFDFLKRHPLAKFKGKDLEGPLKYLKTSPHHTSSASEPPILDAGSTHKDDLTQTPSSETPRILGFVTLIDRKPYLRYLRFSLKPNGVLHITAPKNRPFATIEKEISEYKDWIFKKHDEYEKIRQRFPVLRWQNGERFPFLGESYFLKLEPFSGHRPLIQLDLDQLHYFYPQSWDHKNNCEKSTLLRQALLKFYKNKAVLTMSARTRKWSEEMLLFPKQLSFRNQKTRWGSCSSEGKISFNWRLIAYSQELMDYIIIHELAHLKHQNHSSRFWALVEEFCPEHQKHRRTLRDQQYAADFLAAESELYLENPTFGLKSILPNPHNGDSKTLLDEASAPLQCHFTTEGEL